VDGTFKKQDVEGIQLQKDTLREQDCLVPKSSTLVVDAKIVHQWSLHMLASKQNSILKPSPFILELKH